MEKPTSPSSYQNTTFTATSTATTTTTVESQSFVSSSPPSPVQNHHLFYYHEQDITNNFTSMYNFIFPPKSPLPHSLSLTPSSSLSCSSSDDPNFTFDDAFATTEHRLNQARLILEYQQLCEHFDLGVARLQALIGEVETLRRENSELRVANSELIKLLSLTTTSSEAAVNNKILETEEPPDLNVKRWERRNNNNNNNNNGQMNLMPKSVSARSCNYLKVKEQQGSSNQQRVLDPSLRVYVPSEAKREVKAIEMDVFNQGLVKTELCNKWQETGTCPYAQHCQFAHGIAELRPVIRHPRYKTQVCRMVLAGQICPYGQRCHFRHFLTNQERLLSSR